MKALRGTALKRFLRDYRRLNRPEIELCALLHNVEYPVNVGSCFRIAAGAGIKTLFLTGITPSPPHPTINKVGRFKSSQIDWQYHKEPLEVIAGLKADGYQIVAVELTDQSQPYHHHRFAPKTCLIMGNEEHGITKSVLEQCDQALFIPMYGKGLSLNVHVAFSLVTYQAVNNPPPVIQE